MRKAGANGPVAGMRAHRTRLRSSSLPKLTTGPGHVFQGSPGAPGARSAKPSACPKIRTLHRLTRVATHDPLNLPPPNGGAAPCAIPTLKVAQLTLARRHSPRQLTARATLVALHHRPAPRREPLHRPRFSILADQLAAQAPLEQRNHPDHPLCAHHSSPSRDSEGAVLARLRSISILLALVFRGRISHCTAPLLRPKSTPAFARPSSSTAAWSSPPSSRPAASSSPWNSPGKPVPASAFPSKMLPGNSSKN